MRPSRLRTEGTSSRRPSTDRTPRERRSRGLLVRSRTRRRLEQSWRRSPFTLRNLHRGSLFFVGRVIGMVEGLGNTIRAYSIHRERESERGVTNEVRENKSTKVRASKRLYLPVNSTTNKIVTTSLQLLRSRLSHPVPLRISHLIQRRKTTRNSPHGPDSLDLTLRQSIPRRTEHLLRLLGTVEREKGRDLL